MYTPILEYRVLECHVLRYTSINFNTFARLKIDQTLVFKLPVGSSARGYEWNFCYSPTTYHHFSDGWHPYYNQKEILSPKTEVKKTKLTIRYLYSENIS